MALIVLIVLIGFFWYVGKQKSGTSGATDLIYTNPELTAAKNKERNLTSFIETKIAEQGGLQDSSLADFEFKTAFTAKDFSTTGDNSAEALKQYGLKLKDSLVPLATLSPSEANLVIEAIDNQDRAKIAALQKRAFDFNIMVAALASTTVPTKALVIHLELTNTIAHLGRLLTQMTQALTEPIVALEAARAYSIDAAEFYNVLGKTNQFFNDNNVDFSDSERLKINFGGNQ